MSLINEALKRAQQDKLKTFSEAPPAAPLEPAGDRTGGPSPRKWMCGAAAVVLVGGAAWWFFAEVKSNVPAPAAAESVAEPPLVITDDARSAYAMATEAVDRFETVVRDAPKQFSSLAEAGRKAREAEARAAAEARLAAEARAKEEVRLAAEARLAAKALAAARARDTAKSVASEYKLGGIMKADGKATAIINGLFLREGQTVDGATIIRIEQHTVELEVDGKRYGPS